jgi:type IV pilus assembly protein PilQ
MRFSLRLIGLLSFSLIVASCSSTPSDSDASKASAPSNELEEFGDNDFSSAAQAKEKEQAAAPQDELSLDDNKGNMAEDTAKVEDELKLDDDKQQPATDAAKAFEEPPPQAAPEATPPPPPAEPMVQITDLQFVGADRGGSVKIETSAPAHYQTRRNEVENQFIVEIENATLPEKFKRPYITKEFNSPIASINAYQNQGSTTTRVVIQMRDTTELAVQQDGNSLVVAAGGAPTPAPVPAPVAEAAPAEGVDGVSATGASSFNDFLTGDSHYYGRKINIEVTDEDVRNVFNLIAEESGANMVLDDKVTGPVTVKLRQVPWDQALVVVMKAKGLGYVRQGNVLRISPLDTLKKESETARDIVESNQKLDPLKVKVLPINYANVEDLVKQCEKFLSPRGKIASDNRTSSIIITDTGDTIERLSKLIKTLDVAPDQVLIEGKIVEADSNFDRNIGVNWGTSGQPVAMGNSPSGLPVNLTPSSAFAPSMIPQPLGLALNVNVGTLDVLGSLSAALSLYEKEDTVKVVSSPRIVAMNREKSTISQSDQIPVSQITQTGTAPTISVRYESADLRLEVVPQITPEGGVIMDINVKREYFGPAPAGGGSPAKFGRQAQTRVMVHTGQTAVIGGIYDNTQTEGESGVPYLRNIPVLGWLFKNHDRTSAKKELIIFLTPKILGKTDAQGGAV